MAEGLAWEVWRQGISRAQYYPSDTSNAISVRRLCVPPGRPGRIYTLEIGLERFCVVPRQGGQAGLQKHTLVGGAISGIGRVARRRAREPRSDEERHIVIETAVRVAVHRDGVLGRGGGDGLQRSWGGRGDEEGWAGIRSITEQTRVREEPEGTRAAAYLGVCIPARQPHGGMGTSA
jgi:hypothetical protein